jgi:hypothetical protein
LKQKETEETKKSHHLKFHGRLFPQRALKMGDPKSPITNDIYSFLSSFPLFPYAVQSLETCGPLVPVSSGQNQLGWIKVNCVCS